MLNNNSQISKIVVSKDVCIGCGTCTTIAPDAFKLGAEGKSTVQDSWKNVPAELLMEAAKSCPVSAIEIYDENKTKVFPK
jgi:ferredoxin